MTTTVMIAKLLLGLLWCSAVSITAFAPPLLPMSSITSSQAQTSTLRQRTTQDTSSVRMHGSIIEGLVEFDTLAREWRCKYEDEASLISAQMALESVLEDIQEVDGVKSVERIVCGTCLDFKVVTSLDEESFAAWEEDEFDPEEFFLEMLQDIDGISVIETQTYSKMTF